MIKTDLVQII